MTDIAEWVVRRTAEWRAVFDRSRSHFPTLLREGFRFIEETVNTYGGMSDGDLVAVFPLVDRIVKDVAGTFGPPVDDHEFLDLIEHF